MSRYCKIDKRMRGDRKVKKLSPPGPSGQSLWFHLLTCKQTTNVPGLFEVSRAQLADDLGWSLEDFDRCFKEIADQDMAIADWENRVMWIPNACKYNEPESPNVIRSWASTVDEIPECDLKDLALSQLKAFAEGMGEGFAKAFFEVFGEAPAPAAVRLRRPPSPNQEQEQEQEQEQKQEKETALAPLAPPSDLAKVKAPNAHQEAMNAFCKAWQIAGRGIYLPTARDKSQLGRMIQSLPKEALELLPKLFAAYLQDPDSFVVSQGYSLAYFCTSGGVNKYQAKPAVFVRGAPPGQQAFRPLSANVAREQASIEAGRRFLERSKDGSGH